MLTQERVKELFDYKDGDLYWKIDVAKNIKAGRKAGVFDNFKYVLITINRKIYKAHHIVWIFHYGYKPKMLDHIDGNRSNNKISNLREATNAQNQFNRKINSNSKSGVRGVTWCKKSKKWKAQCGLNGEYHYFGVFDNVLDAKKVVQEFQQRHFGEFFKKD
jgi:hypothetical protein